MSKTYILLKHILFIKTELFIKIELFINYYIIYYILNFKLVMDKNYIELNSEVINMLKSIIYNQNIELLKKISKDYNRDFNSLKIKYTNGEYN